MSNKMPLSFLYLKTFRKPEKWKVMRKFYIVFAVISALSNIMCAQVLLEENFENLAQSPNLSKLKVSPSCADEAKAENAISGKTSLLIDTTSDKSNYPTSFSLENFGLDGEGICKVSFKYKVLQLPEKGANFLYLYGAKGTVQNRFPAIGASGSTLMFGKQAGESGIVDVSFAVFGKDAKPSLHLTSLRGVRIIIDDLKIEKSPLPSFSWMYEPGTFVFLRIQPSDGMYLDPNLPMFNIPKEKFFPFIDKYGQLKHRSWKGKIESDADFSARVKEEAEFNAKMKPIASRDKFGGLISEDKKYKATGRFYAKKVGKRWFLITPEGNLFWSHGIDCAGSYSTTPVTLRENYFEDISDKRYLRRAGWSKVFYKDTKIGVYDFAKRNIDAKYAGNEAEYFKTCDARMAAWGMNTYGAWSNIDLLKQAKTPYALFLNSNFPTQLKTKVKLVEYWKEFSDFFDPNAEELTKNKIAKSAELINSPYCIGVFVDNELPWQRETLLTPRAVLASGEEQYSKIEFAKRLQEKYGAIEKLNAAWNSKYANWADVLKTSNFFPTTDEGKADMLAFERAIAERYFKICRDAVKAVAPDVLYMGCRLAWTNEIVGGAASKYCDVVSFNLYREDVSDFALPEGSKDKPVIIGEFHFGNQDRGVFGGGLRPCKTMRERVEKYKKYVASAVENPCIVGAHWFQWGDQPTTGRTGDGENYSIGFMDIADTPQYEIIEAAREMSEKMYDMRLSGKRTVEIKKQNTITY